MYEDTAGLARAARGSLRVCALVWVLALLFCAGCGRSDSAPPPPPVPEEPLVLFAGKPLSMSPLNCASAVLIEPKTNTVLFEQNAHDRRAPASIVKMTLELAVMREVEAGRLSLEDSIRTSAWASRIGGSQVYLAENEVFPLEELMKAIAIHSANDACVAVAEHIAGTSDGFVRLMNHEIESLGLENTQYVNVHGLDDEPGAGNYTSAWDVSQIGRELILHDHILQWSSIVQAPFRGDSFLLQNTNKLVGRFQGMDGLKTGFTNKAGWCLCATAQRNGMRLLSVVMGAHSNRDRQDETAKLLAAGFNSYIPIVVSRAGDVLAEEVAVRGGRPKIVQAKAGRDVTLIVSRPDDRNLKKEFVPAPDLRAPLRAGDAVGSFRVISGEQVLAEVPALAAEDVVATGVAWKLRRLFRRGPSGSASVEEGASQLRSILPA